jgi:hypothetical protein
MTRYHKIHNEKVPFTAEEEAARDAEEAQWLIDKQARIDAEAAVVANKASTKTKLEALGLTVDEIKDTFNI